MDRWLLVTKGLVWFYIFPPLGLHFVRFLKQIFGLQRYIIYTVDRLNLQLSTVWYVYVNIPQLHHNLLRGLE